MAVLVARLDMLKHELIRDTLKLLETALGQSDLVPAFEDAVARSRGPMD